MNHLITVNMHEPTEVHAIIKTHTDQSFVPHVYILDTAEEINVKKYPS